jgi:uncharacterized protein (DUF433 family)
MSSETKRLITRYIEQDPHHPGKYDARLIGSGVPVWALAASLRALDRNVAQVAEEYGLQHEEVEAALAYYRKYRDLIDARIEANETPDDSGTPVLFDAA